MIAGTSPSKAIPIGDLGQRDGSCVAPWPSVAASGHVLRLQTEAPRRLGAARRLGANFVGWSLYIGLNLYWERVLLARRPASASWLDAGSLWGRLWRPYAPGSVADIVLAVEPDITTEPQHAKE